MENNLYNDLKEQSSRYNWKTVYDFDNINTFSINPYFLLLFIILFLVLIYILLKHKK